MVQFSPGQVIANCEPLVCVVFPKYKGKICDFCFKPSTCLKSCAKCFKMFYCDAKCQSNDWRDYHKHGECKVYAMSDTELGPEIIESSYALRLMIRLLIGIEYNGLDKKSVTMFDGSKRYLKNLPGPMAKEPNPELDSRRSKVLSDEIFTKQFLERCGLTH